jgi:hypothetical protein
MTNLPEDRMSKHYTAPRVEIVSLHFRRAAAEKVERQLQDDLFHGRPTGLPYWVRGVKVVNAGRLQHAVVATENVGH